MRERSIPRLRGLAFADPAPDQRHHATYQQDHRQIDDDVEELVMNGDHVTLESGTGIVHTAPGFGEDDYNGQKAFVDEISDFSLTHNVHIHLVAHARKGEREDAPPDKLDVKGTSGITDLVDNVFMIWRNKPKEQKLAKEQSYNKRAIIEASEPCSIVTCCKQRHGDWEGAILLWFDRASLQYLEEPEFTPKPIYQTKNNAIFAA